MNIKKCINLVRKLNLYNIQKGVKYLKHFGVKEFLVRLSDRIEPEEVPYGPWFEAHRASKEELARQKEQEFAYQPLISIVVPVYKTPEKYLKEMILSVLRQTYSNWELCLVDGSGDGAASIGQKTTVMSDGNVENRSFAQASFDGIGEKTFVSSPKEYNEVPNQNKTIQESSEGISQEALTRRHILDTAAAKDSRIRVRYLERNLGIAGNSNEALSFASGDYIGLLDHDDLLAPDALFEIVSRLQGEDKPELLYTDEDKVDGEGQEHFDPNLKPDFNPDLLRSNNYICHFLVFSRALYERCGGFSSEYDGAQDYDLILRYTESGRGIAHIARVLYHWRTHAQSTADNPLSKQYAYDAGQRAIEAHLKRCGLDGIVTRKKDFGFYRVQYPVKGTPLVSIVIPNKDEKETLEKCLRSIREKTTWTNYEIIIVENNSKTQEIFQYYQEIDGTNHIRVVYWDREFNYSAINNFGVKHTEGDYILLLNNDMEVISPDWIEELLGHCQRPDTGIVGARLYYPDDTIQHAGIILGIGNGAGGGIAGSMFVGLKRSHTGYMHKESLQQDLSAVTAACMMVKREAYEAAGGLEEQLSVAFNDVDFCLRIRARGYLVVYDPYVELYHYESKSRGREDTPEKVRRFQTEIEFMRSRHEQLLKDGDPYYNRNFSLAKWNYSLRSTTK